MDLIGRQIDHYRIDSLLGEGGMGAVYRAWDVNLARPVALKVMHRQFANQAEFQRRFMQEAQAAARLSHPSIAAVHNFGTANSFFYMVLEFIPGGSLNTYLNRLQERGQLLRLDETLPVLAQVADALGYAHRQGVVHRDIKPDNIILRPLEEADREGEPPIRAIVTDFGLAKLMEGGMHTQSGTFMGTLPYMSPEQALGKPLDGRSDIYSLGVLLYQLATGRLPFDIKSPTDAVMKHINQTPPSPRSIRPGLPRTIERIILRAIAKEPADRFQTGEEFARALRQGATNLTADEVSAFAPPETVISLVTQLGPAEATTGQPAYPAPTGRRPTVAVPAGASEVVTQSGQLGVVVQPAAVTVAPGGRADVQVEVLNQGYNSDHYRLTVVGLPPEWVTVSHDSAQLLPGGHSVLNVTIHPPQGETVQAGARPYQLVVASTSNPAEVATIAGQLTVRAFERFLVDMRPERVPNQGICRVLVRNEGNDRTTYTVTAHDPAGVIEFDNQRAQLTLEPGMRGTVDVRLSARERPLTGSPRLLPFEVQVASTAGQRQAKEGHLEVRPALPGWALPVLGLLALCLCLTIGGLYTVYWRGDQAATQTAQAMVAEQTASAGTQIAVIAQQTAEAGEGTAVAATATAEAAELSGDDDNDGLSNSDEERAGTDRGKADTDEDGLSDGEEVNQYGTNPLNQDSDGDGLTDGDEVNVHHTSPSNPDSDLDGVDDGVEIEEGRNPLLPDTPTAPPTDTPTATLPPTASHTPVPTATPSQPAPTVIALPTATPSATPAATATPTTEPAEAGGTLVYVDEGEVRRLSLELKDGLWRPEGDDEQLAGVENVVSVKIAPNGQRVAFVAEASDSANELFMVNTDGTGLVSLVHSADLPPIGNGTARLIDSYQWLADSQSVAFNTLVMNLQGPGVGSNEDLWTVAAGADPVLRFEPGQGGGAFDIAGNRVVMSNDTEIIRANLDGSGREVVHTFPFINTASEYIYYPIPHWTANGSAAYVAIPSPEPFNSNAEAAVWQIPDSGNAVFVTQLLGNILFQPVQWTDSGNRLAYVRQVVDPSNPPAQLFIGGGDGFANLNPYGDEAEQLAFFDWSRDNSHFLYAEQNGGATAFVGTVGEDPVAIDTPGNQVLTGRWLTDATYLIVTGNGSNWTILSGNLDGESADLVTAETTANGVDAWVP